MRDNLVSIIVAIYNVGDFLGECIDSILSQTYENIEILLIDDGSMDDSPKICDDFAQKDSRIRVTHQKNAGVSVARNRGMEEAQGKWIVFVDGDDWLTPDSIEILVHDIKNDEDCDILVGSFYMNYAKKEKFAGNNVEQGSRYEYDLSTCRRKILYYTLEEVEAPELREINANLSSPWGKIFRKSFLEQHELTFVVGQQRAQDEIFNLYAVQFARKIIVINTPVYHYRIWSDSICRKVSSNRVSLDIYYVWNNELIKFLNAFNYRASMNDLYELFVYRRFRELLSRYARCFAQGDYTCDECVNRISSFMDGMECQKTLAKAGHNSYLSTKDKAIGWLLIKKSRYHIFFILNKYKGILTGKYRSNPIDGVQR